MFLPRFCSHPVRRCRFSWRAQLGFDVLEDRNAPAVVAPTPTSTGPLHNPALSTQSPFPTIATTTGTRAAVPPPAIVARLALLNAALPGANFNAILNGPPARIIPPPPLPIQVNVFPDGPSYKEPLQELPVTVEFPLKLHDVPAQLTVSEGESVTFTAEAMYGETPAEHARFSLERVPGAVFPEGAVIDPETGEFSWSPTPGIFAFRVRVQDGEHSATQIVHLRVRAKIAAKPLPATPPLGNDAAIPQPADPLGAVAVSVAACAGLALMHKRDARRHWLPA